MRPYRLRRFLVVIIAMIAVAFSMANWPIEDVLPPAKPQDVADQKNMAELSDLLVKGRAPKTGYSRSQFGDGWETTSGCDTRNRVLARDLKNIVYVPDGCKVASGVLNDPYTGKMINFTRGATSSDDVQIDHVVALSNAWQTGAQQLSFEDRVAFANDPLNLLAVDGAANQQKSDGDAATWLPPNKAFRCQYVSRQLSVKKRYHLWVTPAERDAIVRVLLKCR